MFSVHLKEEARDFLEPETIKDLVKKYSQFINFNIYLWTSKTEEVEEPVEEDTAEDKKDEAADEDKKEEDKDEKKDEDKEKEDKDDEAEVEEESEDKEKKPKTKKVGEYLMHALLRQKSNPNTVIVARHKGTFESLLTAVDHFALGFFIGHLNSCLPSKLNY